MGGQDMRQREPIPNRAHRKLNGTGNPTAALVAPDRPPGVLGRHEECAAELILGPTEIPSDGG